MADGYCYSSESSVTSEVTQSTSITSDKGVTPHPEGESQSAAEQLQRQPAELQGATASDSPRKSKQKPSGMSLMLQKFNKFLTSKHEDEKHVLDSSVSEDSVSSPPFYQRDALMSSDQPQSRKKRTGSLPVQAIREEEFLELQPSTSKAAGRKRTKSEGQIQPMKSTLEEKGTSPKRSSPFKKMISKCKRAVSPRKSPESTGKSEGKEKSHGLIQSIFSRRKSAIDVPHTPVQPRVSNIEEVSEPTSEDTHLPTTSISDEKDSSSLSSEKSESEGKDTDKTRRGAHLAEETGESPAKRKK